MKGTLEYLDDVLIAIAETKAIEHTKWVAEAEVNKAIHSLDIVPSSQFKDALIELAEYTTNRNH